MQVRIALLDNAHALVTCTELVNATDDRGRIAATNVFEKQVSDAAESALQSMGNRIFCSPCSRGLFTEWSGPWCSEAGCGSTVAGRVPIFHEAR